jgi:hypothetical protein
MLTKTKSPLNAPADIEEVEYPPEVIERLNNLREITEAKIAMGEKLNTVREYAAIRGIKIDD